MIKLVVLLHRKPGLTREAFIQRYETKHRLIGEKYLAGYASRYIRRYCRPAGPLDTGEVPADVIMEIWFPDQATFDAAMAHLSTDEAQAEIVADEEEMFDRSRMVSVVVDEFESDMSTMENNNA